MKPGVTQAVRIDDLRRSIRIKRHGADGSDLAVFHRHIGHDRRRSRAIEHQALADQQIVGGGHGVAPVDVVAIWWMRPTCRWLPVGRGNCPAWYHTATGALMAG